MTYSNKNNKLKQKFQAGSPQYLYLTTTLSPTELMSTSLSFPTSDSRSPF